MHIFNNIVLFVNKGSEHAHFAGGQLLATGQLGTHHAVHNNLAENLVKRLGKLKDITDSVKCSQKPVMYGTRKQA